MRGVICVMHSNNDYRKEFLQTGETLVHVDMYQRLHLIILTKYQLHLQRKRVSRNSIFGSIKWNIYELLKLFTKVASPKAYDVFWFWIDSLWVLSGLEKKKLGINKYEYRFIRKEHLTEKDIKMSFDTYKSIHEIRKHI